MEKLVVKILPGVENKVGIRIDFDEEKICSSTDLFNAYGRLMKVLIPLAVEIKGPYTMIFPLKLKQITLENIVETYVTNNNVQIVFSE